jgi:hypothetical protein
MELFALSFVLHINFDSGGYHDESALPHLMHFWVADHRKYVTERKALPNYQQLVEALSMSKAEIDWCVQVLRYEGQIERRILLPTACCGWWTEQMRARWSYRAMRQS